MSRETAKLQRQCIQARKKVYDTIQKTQNPASPKSKKALFQYLLNFGELCRTTPEDAKDPLMQKQKEYQEEGEGEAMRQFQRGFLGGHVGNVPQVHMMLVNKFQSSDAEDPWLQIEWGKVLIGEGREIEAIRHLEVGGLLLLDEVDKEMSGQGSKKIDISGKSGVQIESGARWAVEAFNLVEKISSLVPGHSDPCRSKYELCYAKHVLQKGVPKAQEATKLSKEVAECILELQLQKECQTYASLLNQATEEGKTLTSILRERNING
eukprot:TRINITY_DN1571_c0_g1_i1.p1 TRINITY_DN1571_c0_g1~~TRINITY_DN1571_c0_g1_i1.p1  ORF type:complete len:298 (-),score=59.32 TRINITY_DN1571_c0_g1_i1:176-973(-)